MGIAVTVIRAVCFLLLLAIWARVILSYVSVAPGGALSSFSRAVNRVTDPVLLPVRRVIPAARIGGAALDLSPVLVTIAIFIVLSYI